MLQVYKKGKLIIVDRISNGCVVSYQNPNELGVYYAPLIEDGKNVEEFIIKDDGEE